MTKRHKGTLLAVAAIAALGGGGAAIAGATGGGGGDSSSAAEPAGGDDNATDQSIKGTALDRAKAVALQQTGGGRVTATEIRDEEGYYEIEVRRSDGSQVDVHLDRNFNVLDASPDGSADRGGS
jgi:uncharacterized membrane protein YkoI